MRKRDTLSGDTPLSSEVMMKLGAQMAAVGPSIHCWGEGVEEVSITYEYVDGAGIEVIFVGTVEGKTGYQYCRTVGDLKTLYRMLTDRELEEVK